MADTNALDAAIVRNFDDIEAAYTRATTEIETALCNKVLDIFIKEAKTAGWLPSEEADLDAITAGPIDWRAKSEDPDSELYDLYLAFSYTGDSDLTWLSTFLGSSDMRVGIFVSCDTLSHASWKKMLKSPSASYVLSALSEGGFTIDLSQGNIGIYAAIDREALANGFADGDISEALEPIGRALKSAIGYRDTLDRLVALVREAGK